MSVHHHLVGNSVVLVGSCSTADPLTHEETPTDPTTVTFVRKEPDDTITSYVFGIDPEVVKLATGIYGCTVTVTQAGQERWRYEGTGVCEAAAEHVFVVDASAVT